MSPTTGPAGFDDRVAIVTGATKGIGRACVETLVARGARVVANARNQEDLDALASALGTERVLGIAGDVAEEKTAVRLAEAARDGFGRIDHVVSNTGVGGFYGRPHLLERASFDRAISTNTWPAVALVRACVERGLGTGGSVVTVSAVIVRKPITPLAEYQISKAALEILTRSLAADLAPDGIRVNAVAPGMVMTASTEGFLGPDGAGYTEVIPMHRIGRPPELAAAICFLLSDEASYITGQVLDVDGGFSAVTGGFAV